MDQSNTVGSLESIDALKEEIKTINRIITNIAGKVDIDDFIQEVIEASLSFIGVDIINIGLVNKKTNSIDPAWVTGVPIEIARRDGSGLINMNHDKELGVICVKEKRAVITHDALNDPRVNKDAIKISGGESFALLPLVAGDEAIGFVCFCNLKTKLEIDLKTLDRFQRFVDTLSLFFHNSRIYQEMKELKNSLEIKVEEKTQEIREAHDLIWNFKEYLYSIIQNDTSAIIATDLNGKINVFNRAAGSVFKRNEDSVVGSSIKSLFKNGDFERIMEHLAHVTVSKEDSLIRNQEIEMLDFENSIVKVNLSAVVISARHGNPMSILFIIQDLREVRLLESRVFHSEKLKIIGQMAAGITHEINTPLGMIRGSLEIIRPSLDSLNEMTRKHFDMIGQAVSRATKFISEILDFARPQKEHFVFVSVHELIRKSASIFKLKHMSEKVKLEYVLPESDPGVLGDMERLVQVLNNLFDNACHAISGDGKINVIVEVRKVRDEEVYFDGYKPRRKGDIPGTEFLLQRKKDMHVLNRLSPFAKPGDDVVVIRVIDSGPGIPVDILPKIFEPFFSTKGKAGSGLGLPTIQGIVKRHMGTISVETLEERGTEFIIKLPVYDALKNYEKTPQ